MNSGPRHIVLLIGFLIIIALPVSDQVMGFSSKLFPSLENRQLTKAPKVTFPHPLKFIDDFDAYYKDNFGLRTPLFNAYSRAKLYGLGVSPLPQKLVVGSDGWLFLGNDFGEVIDETSGKDLFSRSELKQIAANITETRRVLSAQGIPYYIAVFPNKHEVYREYLPRHLQDPPYMTKMSQLKEYLKVNIDFDLVDFRDSFNKVSESQQLYYKKDTHWNDQGAFMAYTQLMHTLRMQFPGLQILEYSDLQETNSTRRTLDLARLISVKMQESETLLKQKGLEQGQRVASVLPVPSGFSIDPTLYEKRYRAADKPSGLKLICFRDSASEALIPYLKEAFGESIFLWTSKIDHDLIRNERPNVVIMEIGERNLDMLLWTK